MKPWVLSLLPKRTPKPEWKKADPHSQHQHQGGHRHMTKGQAEAFPEASLMPFFLRMLGICPIIESSLGAFAHTWN